MSRVGGGLGRVGEGMSRVGGGLGRASNGLWLASNCVGRTRGNEPLQLRYSLVPFCQQKEQASVLLSCCLQL
jgi:hypothetical protein